MSDLLAQADRAFDSGDRDKGLALLREHNKTPTADAQSWHRQALVEEQIGNWQTAGLAHLQTLRLAPSNSMGYLFAGNWLEQSKYIDAAAAAYSVVHDQDPSLLHAPPSRLTERANMANSCLRNYLSNQQQKLSQRLGDSGAVELAIWPRTHATAFDYPSDDYAPQLFFLPTLSRKAFYASAEFSWSEHALQRLPEVRQELATFLSNENSANEMRPYLNEGLADLGDLQPLAGSSNWTAIDLFRGGELNVNIASQFQQTLEMIKLIPTYNLGEHPFEAFFSLLKPKQLIAPHFGESNHALTVHLPIEIPGDGGLQVGAEQREWHDDELIVFDDSYLHSAHNKSNARRIVLILSIWHPELNKGEQEAIRQSFAWRNSWYAGRGGLIESALKNQHRAAKTS